MHVKSDGKKKVKQVKAPEFTLCLTLRTVTLSPCAVAALWNCTPQIWLHSLPPWKSCNAVQGWLRHASILTLYIIHFNTAQA